MQKTPERSLPPLRASRSSPRYLRRQQLERGIELYLRDCYARRTAARADECARYLELTPQYLDRRALEVMGMSTRAFLRQRQLHYAEQLLRTTSYSAAEIAVMSAFGTRQAFYRAFRAAYGMTPGRFREQVQKCT